MSDVKYKMNDFSRVKPRKTKKQRRTNQKLAIKRRFSGNKYNAHKIVYKDIILTVNRN